MTPLFARPPPPPPPGSRDGSGGPLPGPDEGLRPGLRRGHLPGLPAAGGEALLGGEDQAEARQGGVHAQVSEGGREGGRRAGLPSHVQGKGREGKGKHRKVCHDKALQLSCLSFWRIFARCTCSLRILRMRNERCWSHRDDESVAFRREKGNSEIYEEIIVKNKVRTCPTNTRRRQGSASPYVFSITCCVLVG